MLDAESPVKERPDAVTIENPKGHVEFDNVSFGYTGQRIISNVSLDVPAGSVVALLGAPGAGKTTLVSLLARFYDPDEGSIRIDGVDVRDATLRSVRSAVGLVQQDVFLFSASVADNIAYGRREASREEGRRRGDGSPIARRDPGAARRLRHHGWGARHEPLRRTAPAAVDCPYAAARPAGARVGRLDIERGRGDRVQHSGSDGVVVQGRTTFIIAHRLSSIQHAQTVVVFDHGKIAEIGTPAELMAAGGLFTHLTELQYARTSTATRPRQGACREECDRMMGGMGGGNMWLAHSRRGDIDEDGTAIYNSRVVTRLARYFGAFKAGVLITMAGVFVYTLATILIPYLIAKAVNPYITGGDRAGPDVGRDRVRRGARRPLLRQLQPPSGDGEG